MQRTRVRGEDAQALVEFALVSIVLLLMLLGTIDLGRFVYYTDAIGSAARTGADVGSNHCPFAGAVQTCGSTATVVSDAYMMWVTYCEAQPAVNLNLGQYSVGAANTKPQSTLAYTGTGSLSACQSSDTSSTWTPTCNTAAGATCTSCANDICIAPATRSSQTAFTVTVGYDFQPITPLMGAFFPTKQCWSTSDSPAPSQSDPTSNGHTICARAYGQVY